MIKKDIIIFKNNKKFTINFKLKKLIIFKIFYLNFILLTYFKDKVFRIYYQLDNKKTL